MAARSASRIWRLALPPSVTERCSSGRLLGRTPTSLAPRPLTSRVVVSRRTVRERPISAASRAASSRWISSATMPTTPSRARRCCALASCWTRRTDTPRLVAALWRRSVSTGACCSGSSPSTITAAHSSISAMASECSCGPMSVNVSSWWSMCCVPRTSRARRCKSQSSSLVFCADPRTAIAPGPLRSRTSRRARAPAAMASLMETSRTVPSCRTAGRRMRSTLFQLSAL